MIFLLLLLLAGLLYFPALRHAVGAAMSGVLLVFVLVVLGGSACSRSSSALA